MVHWESSLPSGLKPKPFHGLQSNSSGQMLLPRTTFYTAKLGKKSPLSQPSLLKEKKTNKLRINYTLG